MGRPRKVENSVENVENHVEYYESEECKIASVRIHESVMFGHISTAYYSINDPNQKGLKLSYAYEPNGVTCIGICIEFKGIKRVFPFSNVRHFELNVL